MRCKSFAEMFHVLVLGRAASPVGIKSNENLSQVLEHEEKWEHRIANVEKLVHVYKEAGTSTGNCVGSSATIDHDWRSQHDGTEKQSIH